MKVISNSTHNSFQHVIFEETTFRNFDFSEYGSKLSQNNWEIHHSFLGKEELRLKRRNINTSFGYQEKESTKARRRRLETTYLKAKKGASEVGDNEIASRFFVKEMKQKKRMFRNDARDNELSNISRIKSLIRYLLNGFFQYSCGYGERPVWVITSSLFSVGIFALSYFVLGVDLSSANSSPPSSISESPLFLLPYLVFSFQAFTSLIINSSYESGNLILQFLASVEGFIGAFLIALFVFSLSRSIKR